MSLDIFLSAGEASSDAHGAELLRALQKKHPNVHCFGMGGSALASAGMDIRANASELNIVGILDWVGKVGGVLKAYRNLIHSIDKRKPDCAVLMDLPDFNLFLAKRLKRRGIPVVYYISPQVWAWRQNRVHAIRDCVDKMLVVFPFEKAFYERHGVPVEFVGHPLLDVVKPRSVYRTQEEVVEAPRLALLPGSRKGELHYHRGVVNKLLGQLWARYPRMEVRIPVATTVDPKKMRKGFPDERIQFLQGASREVLAWGDFAVVASGTATLEAALIGTPSLLFYRVGKVTQLVVQNFTRYEGFIGMPNLLHNREVIKEFFQQKATLGNLFGESIRLIEQEQYRVDKAADLVRCREFLGDTGASVRAASQVLQVVGERSEKREKTLAATPQYT